MDQKWTKHTYVCGTCDGLFEMTIQATRTIDQSLCPSCFNTLLLLSVEDATINNNNNKKEEPPMLATTDFLEKQVTALQEQIVKKDEYITRLQDEVSNARQATTTVRIEQGNFRNSVRDYLVENYDDLELHADEIANILDIELSREVTFEVTMTATVTVSVPVGEDGESILHDNLYIDSPHGDVVVDSYDVDSVNEV